MVTPSHLILFALLAEDATEPRVTSWYLRIGMQNAAGPAFLADCPTRLAVEIISDKWAALVLFGLSQQPRRHGELVDLIGGISRKVLTQTLRRLQRYGLVERHVEAPRRVEYRLTDLGQTLVEPIEVLTDWARDNGEAVVDFQETADSAS
jgi:DNA-binding HxlR family transcriptional regulator